MKTILFAFGLFAVAAVSAQDAATIQGKWTMESSVRNGRERKVMVTQVVIKADKMTFTGPDEPDGKRKSFDVPYKIDAAKEPKTIDITHEKGDEKSLGIYSLDGDTLKICSSNPGKDRPTSLASEPGSEWTLIVLKRKK